MVGFVEKSVLFFFSLYLFLEKPRCLGYILVEVYFAFSLLEEELGRKSCILAKVFQLFWAMFGVKHRRQTCEMSVLFSHKALLVFVIPNTVLV